MSSFADDVIVFCAIKFINDWNITESDIDFVRGRYISYFMKSYISKASDISICRELRHSFIWDYNHWHCSITYTDSVEDV
jgi:hypothetical protein